MSRRHKKKRNKSYQPEEPTVTESTSEEVVHRFKAVQRSKTGEWWNDHKRTVKFSAAAGGVALIVSWLLFELFRLIF